jgi:hypothetical protein
VNLNLLLSETVRDTQFIGLRGFARTKEDGTPPTALSMLLFDDL